jgi:hypothetical protein
MRMFTMPKEVEQLVLFFQKNMERLERDEELWKDERIAKGVTIDEVSNMMTHLVWMVMDISREINVTRHAYGRKKMNFTNEAIELDKEYKKAPQQERSEANQARADDQISDKSG